ncbi:MAG: Crp/Fnr family transcriptional regulator [Gammaproteobacteria bacterium]|nr:Crp/Fnr family transcriptional regulator [Gammaproteobacteria bacterium]
MQLVSGVPEFEFNVLEMSRRVDRFESGQDIFSQNSEATGLHCLRSGHAMLTHVDAFGNKTAFRVVGPGEMMGYRSLFGDDVHTASARALTSCTVCFFPKVSLFGILDTTPILVRRFLHTLARDRGPADGLLLRSQHTPVRVRLVYLLLILLNDYGSKLPDNSIEYRLPLKRHDIGSLIGSRPESVTRAIRELEHDGVAFFRHRNVSVPDMARLFAEANISVADDST